MTYKDNSDGDSSWCTLLISGSNITAKVKHVGSGKYRIIANVTLLIIDPYNRFSKLVALVMLVSYYSIKSTNSSSSLNN